MCEEEAAQKVRLCEQIQHLNHQLEEHSERHSKDLRFMSERIVRSEVLAQRLREDIGTGSEEAAMKNVLEGTRETAGFELRSFQKSISQAHAQNLATFNALRASDQILLEHEWSEHRQLHQRVELLTKQAAALHSEVVSEEVQYQILEGLFDQESHNNQHCLRALEERLEGLWQQLDKWADVQSTALPLRGETEMEMTQREVADNRLHKDLADWFRKNSGSDPSPTWSETEPAASNPRLADQEENEEGNVREAARQTETELGGRAVSPSVTVTAQSENLEDSQITQEWSGETRRLSTHLTVREGQASSSATTCVKIQEVDSRGYFVQLFNTSPDKDVDLSGCILQQTIGSYPVSVYRFPPHTWLLTHRSLTVWAAVADVDQKPPSDLVRKDQRKFRGGPECTTTLCESNGQAIAWYIPAHRFSATANSFDEKDDASEDWVPLPLNDQQISQEFPSQAQYMKQDGWAPSPETMVTPGTPSNSWTDFVPLQKSPRGRRVSGLFSSKGKRPLPDTPSLSERSSVGETDISSYLRSSLLSLPSDSLPGIVTPDSSSPQSTTQMSRRSSDAKGLTSSAIEPRLPRVRSLTGWVAQRSTRPKYGLRFMSYPLITADAHVTSR
ncbi:lamin-B1.S-like [Heptranchias perlo]|uniref:lamin-B1.S-like n=1 Tax=Heptranchias perlo TaxID=212740 RepID=UPI00355AB0E0